MKPRATAVFDAHGRIHQRKPARLALVIDIARTTG